MTTRTILLIILLPLPALLKAQANESADDFFKAAQVAAFEEKNDIKAKQLANQALAQSPQYSEIQVFLGRLYSWNKQYDSAIYHYQQVLNRAPGNEDAIIAYADLEYWNDHYDSALLLCNSGLTVNPASRELLLRKAKILNAQKQYKAASEIAGQLLKSNRRNTAALALASSLKDAAAVNKIGVSYDYSHFDKQFDQPWHLVSMGYSRYTKAGSFSANVNYARRFASNGWQGELEAYPHISKTFYSYVSFGYSPGASVFPKYRAGFSLYANLPRSYEAEAGIRYLHFDNFTYVYTLYLGKYCSNFLLGARTYVTPGSGGSSQSYSVLARYYLKGANDYLGITVGSGISPDDRAISNQYSNKNRLTSSQASFTFNHSVAKMNIISIKAGWLHQEYKTETTGNQLDLSIGLQRRF
jgi:YaiO family outer membrane protein